MAGNNYLGNTFFAVADTTKFVKAIQDLLNSIPGVGVFLGDNLITYQKNLSFLEDGTFMEAMRNNAATDIEKDIIWRSSILVWAARNALKRAGDFVECGAYKGVSARIVCDAIGFKDIEKDFYLYDLFEHNEDMEHHSMPEHGEQLFDRVKQRFADYSNVHVLKGMVPAILEERSPDTISFLHIDMNSATAELGAVETLFDRVSDGAIVVFDDYGWIPYRAQKDALDKFFSGRDYHIAELPTGQGILIK